MTDDDIAKRAILAAGIRYAINYCMEGSKNDKAHHLGTSVTTMNRWLSGAGEPTESNMSRIARCSNLMQEDIRNGGPATMENTDD